jgi:hypothetical protein
MVKKIIILFSILLMAGCGQWVSVRIVTDTSTLTQPDAISKKFYDKNYKIGEIKTAFIGQEIIRIRPYTYIKTKKISYSFEKYASSREPLYIEAQYKFRKYKISSVALKNYAITESVIITGRKYNILQLLDNDSYRWGILIDDNGEIFKSGIYSYDDSMIFYPTSFFITPTKFNISLSKIPGSESEKEETIGGAPFELIYAGKNDVSLNVTYREYTADLIARTAFFQNITYQADAKNIRFKDFVIQIHKASNEKITYTITEDGLKEDSESSSSATSPGKSAHKTVKNVQTSADASQRYKGMKGIELKNGNIIEGQILSLDPDTVKIRTKEGNILSYDFKNEVERFISE